ncbi:MAG: hypothetical protein Q9218_006366, partial [Villophora microphyllina]
MRNFALASLAAAASLCGLASSAAAPSPDTAAATTTLKSLGVDTSKFPAQPGDPSLTCKILNFLYPKNETFTAASTLYTPLVDIPWSQTCWLTPACIVTPKSAQELSVIIRVITALKTKFAVRSGGHKPTPGFNGVGPDGVLIAMQNINSLKLSADTKTLTVGTGNRWRDAYNYARVNGKIIVGGREPMVGVGGFLLGGGVNLFLNTWGLALDLVTRFQ